ncbi:MAG: aminotransferase class I/II-fold pyridoxal phosphate-dependent enzyme [Acidobacteria bacterium]|nr:aminotransferase class I/II-fold pyridoxal phosphate-dependent enzyme [Acidobacteriota bacterium]
MKQASSRARALRRSEIRLLFDTADRHPSAIRLEVGEPSFTTPTHIIEAAAAAAIAGHTGYGPNGGLRSLRELLVEKLWRVNGLDVDIEQIVVTPGGMNALFSIYMALLDPGDQVLLPTPGFPNMDEMVRLVGGDPVFYRLDVTNGFIPRIDDLDAAMTDRSKVLFINTPSNPTGTVFPAAVMEQLVAFAQKNDLWLLSDEVYDELVLDPKLTHTPAAIFDEDGRVITVFSFSKVYAMTGWRVGYAVAPPDIAALLRTLQEPQVSCPSTISQKAAEAALTGPRSSIDAMRDAYRRRALAAAKVAADSGLGAVPPSGTMYMLIDISDAKEPSLEFALRLLEERAVSVAPGSVFGPGGEGWIRISLAVEEDVIAEGMRRIADAVRERAVLPA